MRVCGRLLRPATLAERRLLLGHFGTDVVRVSRADNPYAVVRRIRRLANGNVDLAFIATVIARGKKKNNPSGAPAAPVLPGPGIDMPEPTGVEDAAAE